MQDTLWAGDNDWPWKDSRGSKFEAETWRVPQARPSPQPHRGVKHQYIVRFAITRKPMCIWSWHAPCATGSRPRWCIPRLDPEKRGNSGDVVWRIQTCCGRLPRSSNTSDGRIFCESQPRILARAAPRQIVKPSEPLLLSVIGLDLSSEPLIGSREQTCNATIDNVIGRSLQSKLVYREP